MSQASEAAVSEHAGWVRASLARVVPHRGRLRHAARLEIAAGLSLVALALGACTRSALTSQPVEVVSPSVAPPAAPDVTVARVIFPDGSVGTALVALRLTSAAARPPLDPSLRPLRNAPRGFRAAAFLGDRFVAAFSQRSTSRVLAWTAPDTEPTELWSGDGTIDDVAASPRGTTFAALVNGAPPHALFIDGVTHATRRVQLFATARSSFDARVLFSPGGERLAVGTTPPAWIDLTRASASHLGSSSAPLHLESWASCGLVGSRVTETVLGWAGPEESTYYRFAPPSGASREIPSPEFVSPDGRFEIRPGQRGIDVEDLPARTRPHVISVRDSRARRALYHGPVWSGDHRFVLNGDNVVRVDAETGNVETIASGAVACVAASRSGSAAVLRGREITGETGIYWLDLGPAHVP